MVVEIDRKLTQTVDHWLKLQWRYWPRACALQTAKDASSRVLIETVHIHDQSDFSSALLVRAWKCANNSSSSMTRWCEFSCECFAASRARSVWRYACSSDVNVRHRIVGRSSQNRVREAVRFEEEVRLTERQRRRLDRRREPDILRVRADAVERLGRGRQRSDRTTGMRQDSIGV